MSVENNNSFLSKYILYLFNDIYSEFTIIVIVIDFQKIYYRNKSISLYLNIMFNLLSNNT